MSGKKSVAILFVRSSAAAHDNENAECCLPKRRRNVWNSFIMISARASYALIRFNYVREMN